MSKQKSEFAQRIQQARKAKHLSQMRLADEMDIHVRCIAYWENDSTRPSLDHLAKLAKALEVSAGWLIGVDDEHIRHGTWQADGIAYVCSVCQRWLVIEQATAKMNFCPHCGARNVREE